jgi:hypothetical protein
MKKNENPIERKNRVTAFLDRDTLSWIKEAAELHSATMSQIIFMILRETMESENDSDSLRQKGGDKRGKHKR